MANKELLELASTLNYGDSESKDILLDHLNNHYEKYDSLVHRDIEDYKTVMTPDKNTYAWYATGKNVKEAYNAASKGFKKKTDLQSIKNVLVAFEGHENTGLEDLEKILQLLLKKMNEDVRVFWSFTILPPGEPESFFMVCQ